MRVKFLNTEIDNVTMDEAVDCIDELVQKKEAAYVVTPNVDHIVRLEKDEHFRKIYEKAALILADGKPLIWISHLIKRPLKEKVSGSDLFPKVCQMAAEKGYRMYLLGAAEGVAQKAADNLMKKYEGLQIVGTYSPSYGFEKNETEIKIIKEKVQKSDAQILIVGLGCPKQEKFCFEHCKELDVPVSLCLGASIDFEAGNVKRCPAWMSNKGLEWLYRLWKEPKRMYKRYLVDDIDIFRIYWTYRKAAE